MYSDLNYLSPKQTKATFGFTGNEFTMMVARGQLKVIRQYGHPLVVVDSLASLYSDRDTMVLKRWGYDYESPREKYGKMLKSKLDSFPRCFFRVNDVPEAYYRVFYKGKALKLCVFVFDGFVRCVCFSRKHDDELEMLYRAFEDGIIEIEG